MPWTLIPAFIFAVALLLGALDDAARRTIPNPVAAAAALAYPAGALLAGQGGGTMALHAAGAVAVFAVGLVLFVRGVMGGGDVKLLGAAALWYEPAGLAAFLAAVAVSGGMVALLMLAVHRAGLPRKGPAAAPEVPYGAAIAAGAVIWPPVL